MKADFGAYILDINVQWQVWEVKYWTHMSNWRSWSLYWFFCSSAVRPTVYRMLLFTQTVRKRRIFLESFFCGNFLRFIKISIVNVHDWQDLAITYQIPKYFWKHVISISELFSHFNSMLVEMPPRYVCCCLHFKRPTEPL